MIGFNDVLIKLDFIIDYIGLLSTLLAAILLTLFMISILSSMTLSLLYKINENLEKMAKHMEKAEKEQDRFLEGSIGYDEYRYKPTEFVNRSGGRIIE